MSIHETYLSKERRDARAKELRKQHSDVMTLTIRGQNMHPMYVKDYEEEMGIVLTPEDKGFGNTIYRTYFPKLYVVDAQ